MIDLQPYENEYGEQMVPAILTCHNPACGNCDLPVTVYVTSINQHWSCGGWIAPTEEELAQLSGDEAGQFRPKSCGEQITDITLISVE